jgi:hypothetical protein
MESFTPNFNFNNDLKVDNNIKIALILVSTHLPLVYGYPCDTEDAAEGRVHDKQVQQGGTQHPQQ